MAQSGSAYGWGPKSWRSKATIPRVVDGYFQEDEAARSFIEPAKSDDVLEAVRAVQDERLSHLEACELEDAARQEARRQHSARIAALTKHARVFLRLMAAHGCPEIEHVGRQKHGPDFSLGPRAPKRVIPPMDCWPLAQVAEKNLWNGRKVIVLNFRGEWWSGDGLSEEDRRNGCSRWVYDRVNLGEVNALMGFTTMDGPGAWTTFDRAVIGSIAELLVRQDLTWPTR